MVKLNRNKTSLHLVTSVCLNFLQAIYKGKKNQNSTPSTVTVSPPSFVLLDFKIETNKQNQTKLTKDEQ